MEKTREFRKTSTSASLPMLKSLTVWKILRDGAPYHFTCLLRNLCVSQEATVRTGHRITDWFKIGKEFDKATYCYPVYKYPIFISFMQSTSSWPSE